MNIHEKIFELFENDKYHACLKLCLESIEVDSKVYYPWFYKGKVEYEFARFDSSIKSYETAISLGSEAINVWVAMGLSYESNGNNKFAMDCYLKEIRQFPENCYGWQILAGFLSRRGFFRIGKKILDSIVIKGVFDDSISATEYADCLYYAGTLEEELIFYERILKMNYPLDWIEENHHRVLEDIKNRDKN